MPTSAYYGYLAVYNAIYVVPLAVIVGICTITLGVQKLQEEGGRRLKLLSGVMMLMLSLVLLLAPTWFASIVTAVGVLGIALVMTGLILLTEHWLTRRSVQR